METINKYFTRDEYLDEKGIDLKLELQDDDNSSRKVERFAKEVTEKTINYLLKNYNAMELMNWDNLSNERKTLFKMGCMEQASYILRNGWLSLDSGYNADTGVILDLARIKMSPDALDYFWRAGLANIQGCTPAQPIWMR